MRSEFMLALNQLCSERKVPVEAVMGAVEAALVSAYKRDFGTASNVEVRVEPSTGVVRVHAAKQVAEVVEDANVQMSLSEAKRIDPGAQVGDTVLVESTPRDFGRIAAQTAKQVILQRIREAEHEAQYSAFADSAGEVALGTIQSVDLHSKDVVVALDGAEALLPLKEQVATERYRRGGRLRAYVLEVRRGSRGPQITLSRRTPLLLRRLLELEVPEIANGSVEIKGIAREAGSRSKVAVFATQPGVDPVGSCVGVRGGRIQNVVNELGGEKIDVVQWDPDIATFIASSLSPAKVMNAIPQDDLVMGKTATVIVPDRHLSLAIGKDGQNARLAAKLTGWRIDIKSATEAAEETLGRLEDTTLPPEEMDLLTLAEVILRRRGDSQASAEDRTLIEQEMAKDLAIRDWPEEQPAAGGQIPPAEASAWEPAGPEMPSTVIPPVPEETPRVKPEMAPQRLEEGDLAEEEPLAPEGPPLDLDQEPPFEGEMIEGSSGWVMTEMTQDLYSGWEDSLDQVPEGGEDVWDREDEEMVGEAQRGAKKKKKKKSGKSRYYGGHSPEW